MSKFSERAKKLRIEYGLTQETMAKVVGVHKQTYKNYESGKREPEISTVLKLSKAFLVSIDYLVGESDSRTGFADSLGNRLKSIREENSIPVFIMASNFDVSEKEYIDYENSESMPEIKTLIRFLDKYGISLDYIFCRSNEKYLPTKKTEKRQKDELQ